MMLRPLRPLLFAAPISLACASSTAPVQPAASNGIWAGTVTASSTPAGIVATNQTERPVYYTAFERGMLSTILWAPCVGGPSCRALVQGATKMLPWSEVSGYDGAKKEFVFYWWQAITDADGVTRPGAVQSVLLSR